jgi:hypothetical protein
VVVDKLSKYVHLIPTTKTCTAEEAARLFITHIFQYHGLPRSIISDRDPRFTSKFWQSFCQQLDIEPKYSTAYHPQTDGQTERANRVIEEVLRHSIDNTHTNWEELLPTVSFAINNSKSSSTGLTPFYMNHGAHPITPASLAMPESKLPTLNSVLIGLEKTLQEVQAILKSAQDRQAAYANRSRAPHTFAAGQQVLLKTTHLKFKQGVKKLHPKFIGPFKILKMIGENAAKLELPPTYSRIHPVFHVSLLRVFHQSPSAARPPPEPQVVDNEPWYEVEKILADRTRKRGRRKIQEFLIKWKGYDSIHNSWEPKANISKPALQEYFKVSS